jgi:hypothetical protein
VNALLGTIERNCLSIKNKDEVASIYACPVCKLPLNQFHSLLSSDFKTKEEYEELFKDKNHLYCYGSHHWMKVKNKKKKIKKKFN